MRNIAPWFVLTLFLAACPKKDDRPNTPPQTDTRTPAVPKDHPLYGRVEGAGANNVCKADGECKKSGCSAEICAAEEMNSTCEMPAEGFPPGAGGACGCLSGECQWYVAAAPGRGGGGGTQLPKQAEPCPQGQCAEGMKCVEYYGV